MRRFVAVLAIVLLAIVAWLLWPSETGRAPVPAGATAASEREATKSRAPRQRGDAVAPVSGEPSTAATPTSVETKTDKPETTHPFVVTVLRADGSAAAGATVALVDPNADDGTDNVVARGTSDEKGVATLRAPESSVRVAAWLGAEATASGEIVAIPGRDSLTVRMSSAIVIRGCVLRGETPEAGADVEVSMSPWFGSEFGFALRTKSGADGRFEVPAVALAGIDPLNPPNVEAITKDMARGFGEVDLAKPDAEVIVRLTPGFTARARFVDADGKPVAVQLRAVGARTWTGETDADGRVALPLPDAAFALIAVRASSRVAICGYDGGDPLIMTWHVARALAKREAGAGGDADLGDIVMKPGKPLVGRVVDSSGKPSPKAQASLFLGNSVIGFVVADVDGRFTFPEVGDDAHRVHVDEVLPESSPDVARHADVENVRGGDPDLRVVLADELFVTLKLLSDGDRKPVSATDVRLKVTRHGQASQCAGYQGIGDPVDTCGFEAPGAGSYDVELAVGGYETQRFEGVEVVAGRPTTIDVLLRKKHE